MDDARGRGRRAGPKPITQALQGGGAHGAFTWGVLDRLLENDGVAIEAISGTSAGAMNGAALASGLAAGGREGGRAALARFRAAIGGLERLSPFPRLPWDRLTGRWSLDHNPGWIAFDIATRLFSPYQVNPRTREDAPTTASGILNRINEISFNASLMRELRAIAFVSRLIETENPDPARYPRVRVHMVEAEEEMRAVRLLDVQHRTRLPRLPAPGRARGGRALARAPPRRARHALHARGRGRAAVTAWRERATTIRLGPAPPHDLPPRAARALNETEADAEVVVCLVQVAAIVMFAALCFTAERAFPPDVPFEPVPVTLAALPGATVEGITEPVDLVALRGEAAPG
jgi:NTE family protein